MTFKVKLHEIQGKKVPEEIDEETLKQVMPGEEKVSVELFEEKLLISPLCSGAICTEGLFCTAPRSKILSCFISEAA